MKGDIFIHAGDFTHYGKQDHFLSFFDFIDKLNFRYKIILAGNHEISLDNRFITAK
jgi:3',5'-cyclic AMP phosphodiesterase CpdA